MKVLSVTVFDGADDVFIRDSRLLIYRLPGRHLGRPLYYESGDQLANTRCGVSPRVYDFCLGWQEACDKHP
jgi:hypothetical protein